MRRFFPIAIGIVGLGLAAPAAAQDYGYSYGYENDHHRVHDQLKHERDDLHRGLRDQHHAAHDQGLDPWGHSQLHSDAPRGASL